MLAAVVLAAALASVNAGYEALWASVQRAPAVAPATKAALDDLFGNAAQTLRILAEHEDATALADLDARSALDAVLVPALLGGPAPVLATSPGAHAGVASVRGVLVPFAYRLPAGFDPRRPGPLVVLVHGNGQPPTDLATRAFLAALVDRSHAILLAPGGDETDPAAIAASAAAAEAALATAVHWDRNRRYLGGYSNGAFAAFHIVATQREPCAGVLAIAGVMLPEDRFAVRLRLARFGAYFVVGTDDPIVAPGAVRSSVRVLRAGAVFAHYYEVRGAGHGLALLAPAIATAWSEMLAGITRIPDDGLGTIPG